MSHTLPTKVSDVQERLRKTLQPEWEPAGFQLRVEGNGDNEPTQRTRGLLFMAAGLLVGSSHRIKVVNSPENGLLAINPPLTPARTGAASTKSVHPWTLSILNGLLSNSGCDIRVENPYLYATKGEMCQRVVLLGQTGRGLAAMAETVSCSGADNRNGSYDNCGRCYPCLVRHAALRSAGGDLTNYRCATPGFIGDRASGNLLAVWDWLSQDFTMADLIGSARLPGDVDHVALLDMLHRSRSELESAFGI